MDLAEVAELAVFPAAFVDAEEQTDAHWGFCSVLSASWLGPALLAEARQRAGVLLPTL